MRNGEVVRLIDLHHPLCGLGLHCYSHRTNLGNTCKAKKYHKYPFLRKMKMKIKVSSTLYPCHEQFSFFSTAF